jgi:hypothetical protein
VFSHVTWLRQRREGRWKEDVTRACFALHGGGVQLALPLRKSAQCGSKARLSWVPTKHWRTLIFHQPQGSFFSIFFILSNSHVFTIEKNIDSMRNSKDAERKITYYTTTQR